MVLEVAPRLTAETPLVLKLKMTLPNGVKKTLELVRQTQVLKVNVNPDPLGFDEWVVGGEMYYVMSDPEETDEQSTPCPTAEAVAGTHAGCRAPN